MPTWVPKSWIAGNTEDKTNPWFALFEAGGRVVFQDSIPPGLDEVKQDGSVDSNDELSKMWLKHVLDKPYDSSTRVNRFVVVAFSLIASGKGDFVNHRNYLVFDRERKTVTRLEPHGAPRGELSLKIDALTDQVKVKLRSIAPDFQYINRYDIFEGLPLNYSCYLEQDDRNVFIGNVPIDSSSDDKGFDAWQKCIATYPQVDDSDDELYAYETVQAIQADDSFCTMWSLYAALLSCFNPGATAQQIIDHVHDNTGNFKAKFPEPRKAMIKLFQATSVPIDNKQVEGDFRFGLLAKKTTVVNYDDPLSEEIAIDPTKTFFLRDGSSNFQHEVRVADVNIDGDGMVLFTFLTGDSIVRDDIPKSTSWVLEKSWQSQRLKRRTPTTLKRPP